MDIRGAERGISSATNNRAISAKSGSSCTSRCWKKPSPPPAKGWIGEKGEQAADHWSPQINLGTSILIPDHYVEDLNVRMSLYHHLSDLKDKNDLESFAAELIDRFGKLPDEVENLLQIIEIKQLCRLAGIDRLDAGPKGAVIGFNRDAPPNIPGLDEMARQGKVPAPPAPRPETRHRTPMGKTRRPGEGRAQPDGRAWQSFNR